MTNSNDNIIAKLKPPQKETTINDNIINEILKKLKKHYYHCQNEKRNKNTMKRENTPNDDISENKTS